MGVLLSGCSFNFFGLFGRSAAEPEPVVRNVEVLQTGQVAVLLSNDLPDFIAIAEEVEARLDAKATVYSLGGEAANAENVLADIDAAGSDRLVAVGLLAAQVGREQQSRPMVFCQTYNYKEHDLVSASSKGVGLLPPFDKQFDTWRELDPNLQRVGLLTGPNQEDLLADIRSVADRKGIRILSRTVSSDKEALLKYRRMRSHIQGLIILPDNRILSPRVLREIMSIGAKSRTQIAVYAEGLLNLGALMSFTGQPDDIADAVVERLQSIGPDGRIPGPDLVPLEEINVQVNPAVADHLSLIVPSRLARSDGGG